MSPYVTVTKFAMSQRLCHGTFTLRYNNKMRRRTNSLSVKVKALQSLKKISQQCYDLTSPALTTPTKPLLCQVEPFNRSSPQIEWSPLIQRSAPVAQTTRTIAGHSARATSLFSIDSPLNETEAFCKKVYTTRLIQTQAKENSRQKSLFIRKLSKAVKGNVLNASGYELGPLGVKQIGDFLLKNNMVELILDRNGLKDQGVMQLIKFVSSLRLRHLSLSSVGMTQRSCRPLISELANMPSLQQLNISSQEGFNRNRLHKDAFQNISHLTGAGAGKTNLKILRCGGVGLDDSNFQALCLGLGRGSRLQVLSIDQNEVTGSGMAYFKEHAVKVHLRYLDISANKIEGGGLVQLGSLIGSDYNLTKISKALHTLKVSKGKIRSGTLAAFAKTMPNNQILQELYLDGNPLGEGGKFNIFAIFLSRCWSIKKLSLCQSLRSTEQVLQLCESLQSNRGVQTLLISRNSLQYCAFKKLMQILGRNKTLKRVHLESCGIVDSYVAKAQESIMQLKYLQQIYLDHNYLNDNAAQILEKAIYRNKSLVKVQLHNNSLGIKMQQQIQRALQYNREAKKFDGPDLSYYAYVEELQAQQKSALNATIQQLRQKENHLNCRQLLHVIAKKDLQTKHRATEVEKEAAQVLKMNQIRESLKKIQQMQRRVQQSEQNDQNQLPVNNDSVVSFGQMSSLVSREASETINSCISSNLSQTH